MGSPFTWFYPEGLWLAIATLCEAIWSIGVGSDLFSVDSLGLGLKPVEFCLFLVWERELGYVSVHAGLSVAAV